MEWIAVISVLLVILGLLGSILPVMPGPPLAWLALLLLKWQGIADFSITFLIVTALVTIAIELLDYFLPVWFAQLAGGSKMGKRGAMVGIILGLVAGGPVGLILGSAIGAFIGEWIYQPRDFRQALKSAGYSFLAFVVSTGMALVWCGLMGWWVLSALTAKGLFSL